MKDVYDSVCSVDSQDNKEFTKYSKMPSFDCLFGDMLEHDWSNADFVLANSTCFDMELMQKIANKS